MSVGTSVFLTLLSLTATVNCHSFETVYSWKEIDFNFPNDSIRQEYTASGDYIQKNNAPVGINIWRNKLFVTVPRWKKGVPANLNYIDLSQTENIEMSPALTPYPDWDTNDIHSSSSNAIVSIFRVRVDKCNRLWGLDTGIDDIVGDNNVVAPPTLIVIDLTTDKIIRRYPLKDSDQKADSFFADMVVDVEADSCDNAYAYISDLGGYGLVVYSWAENNSWRVSHNYFYFDPLQGDYNVNGINFQWTDGIFGLSLSEKQQPLGYKTLYFHAMSGITEFEVSTIILKNETTATSSNNYYDFEVAGIKGELTQGPSCVIDTETGIDYFTHVNRNGIGCWDTSVKLTPDTFHILAEDAEKLRFPNDLAIRSENRKLYVLADNFAEFLNLDISLRETNYVITAASLDTLANECKCQSY
ncbi:protein yellow isoform X2 [Cephus cinctus]|uniref:Protein yellow isoform X2 n=1 Tax=Cephus cinctus TaxID=211228 RepID=A0AAJ7C4W4_CEPCN|nr:protein yellow isoform X2 [Cephus cinctus]